MEEVNKEAQPVQPQKDSYVKLPKWLVILLAIVIIVVIAGGMLVAGIMLGKNQSVGPKLTNLITPVPTSVATLTPSVSAAPVKVTPVFPPITNPNLVRFTSEKLGVSFTYLKSQNGQTISAKEINDKIYVYFDNTEPSSGQYAMVMGKDKSQTMEDAIKMQILNGYSPTDCVIQPATQYVPAGFQALEIVVPFDPNATQDEIVAKSEKCPTAFTAMGGMAYFVEDPNHPDKMIFLSIGQYLIQSEGNNVGWQNTLQLF
jgi:hypothetical protein